MCLNEVSKIFQNHIEFYINILNLKFNKKSVKNTYKSQILIFYINNTGKLVLNKSEFGFKYIRKKQFSMETVG